MINIIFQVLLIGKEKFSLYFYFIYPILGKRSISSQYKGNNNVSSAQQNTNSETLNRRVELQQRIEETRRMLQNVCIFIYFFIIT